ncbi:unnamed protein product [Prunus armeniaca]
MPKAHFVGTRCILYFWTQLRSDFAFGLVCSSAEERVICKEKGKRNGETLGIGVVLVEGPPMLKCIGARAIFLDHWGGAPWVVILMWDCNHHLRGCHVSRRGGDMVGTFIIGIGM